MSESQHLIWIDCEMTGLSPDSERLIEVATIVTDKDLNILAEGPVCAIKQDEALLGAMDDWNQKQHGQSGLLERVRASKLTESDAEQLTIDFLAKHIEGGVSPMCGNSICLDKRFLARYMPKLCAYFHYRMIDVSTIKELARRWQPALYENFNKDSKHLALDDIKDSIEELRYYRQHFFI